jgi:hypothetical protein
MTTVTVGKGRRADSLEGLLLERLILGGVSLVAGDNESASRGLLLSPVTETVTGVAVAVIVEVSVVEVVVDRSSSSDNSRVDSGSRNPVEKVSFEFISPIETIKNESQIDVKNDQMIERNGRMKR